LTRSGHTINPTRSIFRKEHKLKAFVMVKPQIAPVKVFEHAECFYQALAVLRAVHPENILHLDNLHAAVTLVEPGIVLGALTIELFLKCLISIEAGDTPRGHNLKELFDQLSAPTRTRIQNLWDSDIATRRNKAWDDLERLGLKMARDLPSALTKGSNAFERIRYSYEGNTQDLHYYLEDLPALLEGLILEMKPEFEAWRRMPLPRRPSGTNRF
jgi:hypothetical protein